MRNVYTVPQTPIEGYFRRSQQTMIWMLILSAVVIIGAAIAVIAIMEHLMQLVVGIIIVVGVIGFVVYRQHQKQTVKVYFDNDMLTLRGGGYHIQMQAPFRYQTGVQRVRATHRAPEFHYVRMVLDVYGKPLVFEEQVPSGIQPPKLDEIISISSAMGIAELSSTRPYPGSLWAIIQRFEEMSSQSHREQVKRDIEYLYGVGGQQLDSENYYAAIQTFSEIIRLTPDSPYPYYNRGTAYFYYGNNHDKALRDLTTAIRLKPKFANAYRIRGLVKGEQMDWAGSRDDLTEAIRLNPNERDLYNIRGGACYRLQDYQSALKDFDRAIRLEATNPEPYHNRGLVKHRMGDLEGAIADFQQALKLKPSFVAAQKSLALVEHEKQQLGQV